MTAHSAVLEGPVRPRPGLAAGSDLLARYQQVRQFTDSLCEPLEIEDYVVQSMPDASPVKWHLAHTSWFFEALLLREYLAGYRPLDEAYNYLFNSYYNSIGEQFTRACRGLISRPTVAQVREYRRHVDDCMGALLAGADEDLRRSIDPIVEVGLNHEQQHQELLLTDLKHMLSRNPLAPVYRDASPQSETDRDEREVPEMLWHGYPEGLVEIGHEGSAFAYDNEGPRHRRFVETFEIASRLVTAGEYQDFIHEGGYERADWWLSDGWATIQTEGWSAPLYWTRKDGSWHEFTLGGLRPVRPGEPVCHLSYYEADAYARWVSSRIPGVRLPREDEWEIAATSGGSDALLDDVCDGNFVDDGVFHTRTLTERQVRTDRPVQMLGDVWEWTSSPYVAYPGYRSPEGALGEYNAKFMSNQLILRGGSCATSRSHIRATYRNFFPAHARWQFSGLRLARDTEPADTTPRETR